MKLLSIINEELNGLLNEISDEDIVDINKIDIQKEYDDLNKLLYDGELPRIPLIFNSKRHGYARVTGLYNRATRQVTLKNLEISNQYNFTYKQFRNILAHELIHVFQMGIRKERGGHGWDFHYEARRINGMGLGFEITETNGEDIPASDLAKQSFNKKLIAMIINKDGKYFLVLASPALYAAQGDKVFNIFQNAVNYGQYKSVEITAVETSNAEIAGFPVARTFERRVSQIPLSDRLLEMLLNDKIIRDETLTKQVKVPMTESNSSEWEEIEIV